MVALGLQRIRVGPLLKSHRSSIWPRFESIWPQKKRDREGRDPCDPRWPSGRPRRLSSRRPVLLLAAADLRPSLHPAASALPRSVLASYAATGSRSLPRVDPPPSRSPRCRLLLTPLLAAGPVKDVVRAEVSIPVWWPSSLLCGYIRHHCEFIALVLIELVVAFETAFSTPMGMHVASDLDWIEPTLYGC
jgi:hypothetical protein